MTANNFICDERMQWIKIGEEQEWIRWSSGNQKIECENFPTTNWEDITLSNNTACELKQDKKGKTCTTSKSTLQVNIFFILLSQILVQLGH